MQPSPPLRSHRLSGGASCDVPWHAAVRTVINSRVASSPTCYRAAMAKLPPGEPTVFADDPDDDTIEMVLSPEDMHRLSRAAEEQERAAAARETEPAHHAPPAAPRTQVGLAPGPSSEPPPDIMSTLDSPAPIATTTPRRRPPQNIKSIAWGALAGAAGALIIVAAIASWSTAHRTIQAEATPPPEPTTEVAAVPAPTVTASASAASAPSPQPPAAPDTQPVRYKNPFDRREIFEFPPGTTLEEARQSVADVLRQRARDRRIQPVAPPRSRIARNG